MIYGKQAEGLDRCDIFEGLDRSDLFYCRYKRAWIGLIIFAVDWEELG